MYVHNTGKNIVQIIQDLKLFELLSQGRVTKLLCIHTLKSKEDRLKNLKTTVLQLKTMAKH